MDDAHDPATGEIQAEMSFSAMMFQMDNGAFHAEVTKALTNLMQALRDHLLDTGDKVAKGSIAVSFSIRVDAGRVVEIFPEYSVKEPKAKSQRRVMFLTADGKITARNPNQPDLPFTVIGRKQAAAE